MWVSLDTKIEVEQDAFIVEVTLPAICIMYNSTYPNDNIDACENTRKL